MQSQPAPGPASHSFGGAFRGARVLVTGHTGFKGSWLTSWLLHLGAEVFGLSKDVPTRPSLFDLGQLASRVHHQVGDIRDLGTVRAALQEAQPQFVFHLAAQPIVSLSYQDPLLTLSSNVMGTAHVLEALREFDRPCAAIIVTSDKCYDNLEWVWGYRETDALGGKDIYSGSKAAAEAVFRAYWSSFFGAGRHPVRLASARAGNVIGGGDWAADRIVADCIRAWGRGERVPIRSPQATRPWQHVLEPLSGYLALAARLAGDAQLDGESFNFGPSGEQNRSVLQLLGDLGAVWGLSSAEQACEITGNVPFHEAGLLKLSCDKALLRLGWRPTLGYGECVQLTGGWYREVLRENADALGRTHADIARYEALASERAQGWAAPAQR